MVRKLPQRGRDGAASEVIEGVRSLSDVTDVTISERDDDLDISSLVAHLQAERLHAIK
jgi:hypothetical protein